MRRVALVAFASVTLLAVAGCAPEEAESSPDIVESRGAVDVLVEVADGGEAGIVQPDGRALLSSALAMYEDGYEFAAVAEVQGLEAAATNGVVIEMSLHFVDGRLVSASYETGSASVSTTFSPLNGASIEAPTPLT